MFVPLGYLAVACKIYDWVATVAVVVVAAVLLVLPGGGVAQLLGIGVGLFGIAYPEHGISGPAAAFVGAFVLAWVVAVAARARLRRS